MTRHGKVCRGTDGLDCHVNVYVYDLPFESVAFVGIVAVSKEFLARLFFTVGLDVVNMAQALMREDFVVRHIICGLLALRPLLRLRQYG